VKGSRCPRGGVNWAFIKLIARIKSYKPNFTLLFLVMASFEGQVLLLGR
jgi:hypothetical protein